MDEESVDGDELSIVVTASSDSPTRHWSDRSPANGRLPLEYAFALDAICATFDPEDLVYVATGSATLLQAVVNRHDRLVSHENAVEQVLVDDGQDVVTVPDNGVFREPIEHVLVIEPATVEPIEKAIDATTDRCPHDCLVGNPFSFNRIEDRAVNNWLSPRYARGTYENRGFKTSIAGYHGPRSILQSALGRAWQVIGRPDRHDVYTHRMRAAYREGALPLALLSCIVHVRANPEGR